MTDLPFQVEYARSAQSTCKGCLRNIPKSTLRIARVFKSLLFEGNQLNWFHRPCFFKYHRPISVFEFLGFEHISSKDQQLIREDIVRTNIKVKIVTTRDGRREARMTEAGLRDFAVQYARTGRAKCRLCEEPIEKMSLRVKKTVFDTEIGMKHGGEPLWHHLVCFAKVRTDLGWFASGEQLPGFKILDPSDQSVILKMITAIELVDNKKNIKGDKSNSTMTKVKRNHKAMQRKSQSKGSHRGGCHRGLIKLEMVALLRANQQHIPKKSSQILGSIKDMLMCGALQRCPTCCGQFLRINNNDYACEGQVSDGIKCVHITQNPTREPIKIPAAFNCVMVRNQNYHRALQKLLSKDKSNSK